MRNRSISRQALVASIALMTGVLITSMAVAQMDQGPKTDKTYGIGLPRITRPSCFPTRTIPYFH
jgi:hypothetical protein